MLEGGGIEGSFEVFEEFDAAYFDSSEASEVVGGGLGVDEVKIVFLGECDESLEGDF